MKKSEWLTVLLVLVGPPAAEAQGVSVALSPAFSSVVPGSQFELDIQVVRTGSAFNAFDAYIGYDPGALTLVPQTPLSNQEGAYFKAACANRFHRFRAGAGVDTISDVLLCPGASVTGPGQIYRLFFRASNTVQVTTVHFLPGLQFYYGGEYVNPDSSSDAVIGIGVPEAVTPPGARTPLLRLLPLPNPARGKISFRIQTDRDGWQRLVVMDVQGRLVRHMDDGTFPAGARTVTWDCRNDSGSIVPPGNYSAALRVPGRDVEAHFSILE